MLKKTCSTINNIVNNNKNSTIWIAGDFNLPDIDWNELAVTKSQYNKDMNEIFLDTFLDQGLKQMINFTTREKNILDLFFTNRPNLINKCSNLNYTISDHDIISIDSKIKPTRIRPIKRLIHLWNKTNPSELKNNTNNFKCAFLRNHSVQDDPSLLWKCITNSLDLIISDHVPTKTSSSSINQPWLNTHTKRLIRKKKKLYKKLKNCQSESLKAKLKSVFQEVKKETQKECRKAHNNYLNDIVNNGDLNKKKFWNFIKSKNKDTSNTISELKDDKGNLIQESSAKANILNNQFFSVFSDNKDKSIGQLNPKTKASTMPNIIVDNKGVLNLLNKLQLGKAAGADSIPSNLLKICSNQLAPVFTLLFQASLNQGKIPEDWKQALIVPIFKKGDRTIAENYRPVSLTSITCKILEHIIHSSVMKHLERHKILNDSQHGFRKFRSCESQLISTVKDFTESLEDNVQTDAILLDFSKAFDKVHHPSLLLKLDHYGIRNNLHSWIQDFLSGRTQKVVLEGKESTSKPVLSGVPQGTVLGPLLFLVYINDISEKLSPGSILKLFADDSLLYRRIYSKKDADILQNDLDTLAEWGFTWKMAFHPKKCQVISFRHSKTLLFDFNYSILGTLLERTENAKYLGIILNCNLIWKNQINSSVGKANSALFFLKRHLYSCPQNIKEQCYFACVRSKVEYACSVWDPHLKEDINNLEKVQRRAARFVTNTYDNKVNCNNILKNLGWNPLTERRAQFKVTNIFKAKNNLLEIPLSHLPLNRNNTRASSNGNYAIPRSLTTVHLHSFYPSTVRLWNAIPGPIQNSTSVEAFKVGIQSLTFKCKY